ncbi:MAG: Uma2 family endonuclease [Scytonematopsis contorta HA4267-MV1]|nr:Uma2 family endonuclease [Scytonematopsis contorta HA4267-MV1]
MTNKTAKRFSIEEYHRLIELGFFAENDRVELIRGELVDMTAKRTPHSVCTTRLLYELVTLLQKQAIVRSQEPIVLPPNSEPEPDIAIVRNRVDNYFSGHPQSEDIIVVVEVSDSTLKYDQEEKLSLYAESGINNYCIFNLVSICLEVYTQPYQNLQGEFDYASKQVFLPDATVAIPEFTDLSLNLSEIFTISS